MTTTYSEPWHSRPSNRRVVVVVALAVLLLLAAAVTVPLGLWQGFASSDAEASAATTAAGAPSLTFSVGTISGASGTPVQAPIRVAGAHGLGSASLRLTYDPSVVTVTGVAKGDLASSTLTWHHDATAGVLTMLLTTPLATGIQGAGVYAIVTLEAVEGAMGKSAPLALSVGSAASAEHKTLDATTASGSFRNGVPGDVSGDGVVDREDYDLLSRYLVGEQVTILQLNADLDGDGKVTDLDALILHQQVEGAAPK